MGLTRALILSPQGPAWGWHRALRKDLRLLFTLCAANLPNLAIKSATHEWNWRGREIGRPGLHQPYTYAVCELAGVW